jgi:tetratricopeptide (TPR) repeat protein
MYNARNDFGRAIERYQVALEMRTKYLPEHHPEIAKLYTNIGTIHYKKESYTESVNTYEKALICKLHCFSASHPEVALTKSNLACALGKRNEAGDDMRAEKLYKECLTLLTGRKLATTKENYSALLEQCGRYEEALAQLKAARTEHARANKGLDLSKVKLARYER